jgi:TatD DNase family protein
MTRYELRKSEFSIMNYIDTHTHIDGEEFCDDRDLVIQRAREAGAVKLLVPAINLESLRTISEVCESYPDYCYGMMGLHPEDVNGDYEQVLAQIKGEIDAELSRHENPTTLRRLIAIGEVGLDFYWSREFENEQLEAFERQVEWSVETGLPLMIHCRKAQNEMVRILRRYEKGLHGGVFHCFTGNEHEAQELLQFEGFALGIGGVLTFKKSNLPTTLPAVVPLSRIVLETDAPYMAPVPHRGERNESSFIPYIIERMAEAYGVEPEEVARTTTDNAERIFF